MKEKHTNALKNESSPYLLQHAHNPVNWHPWNEKTLEMARNENKLLLISVGYAACHWCHVMEKESFESEEVAGIMNANFINIKVDREERPDIDQVYMDAVQLMTGAGGWPMNVVALPDGRPFWGGTYFKKNDWISYLKQIAELFKESPEKVEEYAKNLTAGVCKLHEISDKTIQLFSSEHLKTAIADWSKYFDLNYGGPTRAPKFMMPVNFEFFLKYAFIFEDHELLNYIDTTLTKMAHGGLYDAIGGGFSRYAVDARWHVPHFEKMLYDNGQLVSLYSNAFKISKNELYEKVIRETLKFIEKELTTPDFAFYSSLDADSLNDEGILEEGAYYIWTEEELKTLLKEEYAIFKNYYNINDFGHWENGKYVLIRSKSEEELAHLMEIEPAVLKDKIEGFKKILSKYRDNRPRPRLDDKIITSWNALMLKGYTDAFKALGDQNYLDTALKNAHFLKDNLITPENRLYHSYKNGKRSINGYLEDYALCADAFINLYEACTDESWIFIAKDLVDYCIAHFYSPKNEIFFFTSDKDAPLVTRAIEKNDNVIPSSNSVMQKVLFKLARFLDNTKYDEIAEAMMKRMLDDALEYPYSHANWLNNYINFTEPFAEVVLTGKLQKEKLAELNRVYLPHIIVAGTEEMKESLPLFEGRLHKEATQIFVCYNKSCKLPVATVEDALKQL